MRISAIFRIAVALAGVIVTILLTASALDLFPISVAERVRTRKIVCENVAVQCCLAAQRNDTTMMQVILSALHSRNPEIVSVGLRREKGGLQASAGEHRALWQEGDSSARISKAEVPIYSGKKRWGMLEVAFMEPTSSIWTHLPPATRAVAFVASAAFLAFLLYLRRMLQYLDPSSVVPDRVRQALDTLAEGVVIVDPSERIVLANRAFAKHVGTDASALQGRKVGKLGLKSIAEDETAVLPWLSSLHEGATQRGVLMSLADGAKDQRTFAVNTAPIVDADGKSRGALATFDDITEIEQKNKTLHEMLDVVKRSRDEVRIQNELLTKMATCDALTGCFNRRYLFSHLEKVWNSPERSSGTLGCIMLDIDHFKSVNDTHGHAKGDAVLQEVAARLQATVDSTAVVCRYGGEEFCIVLADSSLDKAAEVGEKLRAAIAEAPLADLKITSSFGVTASSCGAPEPAALLEQADKSLYFSKHNGRNRVTKFGDLPPNFSVAEKKEKSAQATVLHSEIPFHAVTALLSTLSFRDWRTADHSRRVADLCVAVGRKYMSQRECYILEVAALLHDIGKVGVPDAILLKPGPLTTEEWEVMQIHDRIGVEILNAAFSCDRLNEIVRTHHAWFGGGSRERELPTGDKICIEARILAAMDAYDAIVSDRVYRKGRSRDEAIVELRRCSGTQFDPGVIEKLVEVLMERPDMQINEAQVSKSAALQIGLHIERLAEAVDARDVQQLSAVADRLGKTAAYVGIDPISQAAKEVATIAASEPDLAEIVCRTSELLDLCRSTQRAFLQTGPFQVESH
jgi:diguanylate cyclase (GGDEF)-like protein/PAS domain S-box-containing protein